MTEYEPWPQGDTAENAAAPTSIHADEPRFEKLLMETVMDEKDDVGARIISV